MSVKTFFLVLSSLCLIVGSVLFANSQKISVEDIAQKIIDGDTVCLVSCSGSSCDNSMTMRDVDDFERQITKIEQSVISREDLRAKILDFGYQYISKSNYDDLNWDRYTILCGSWFSEQRRFLQVGYDQDGLVVRVTTDIPR